MKNLSAQELNLVSGGIGFDQVLGRGFTFGAAVGLVSGGLTALATAYQQTNNWVSVAIGAAYGTCFGAFAGAVIAVPFTTYFNTTETIVIEDYSPVQ